MQHPHSGMAVHAIVSYPDPHQSGYETMHVASAVGYGQAKANGLQLCSIPAELSNLNALEVRLISLRVLFMQMVALPAGKQRSIHGPAVNVCQNLIAYAQCYPVYLHSHN